LGVRSNGAKVFFHPIRRQSNRSYSVALVEKVARKMTPHPLADRTDVTPGLTVPSTPRASAAGYFKPSASCSPRRRGEDVL
jgi:hypothetical protein